LNSQQDVIVIVRLEQSQAIAVDRRMFWTNSTWWIT